MRTFFFVLTLLFLVIPAASLTAQEENPFTQYIELRRYGNGELGNFAVSPDGTKLVVASTTGANFYEVIERQVDPDVDPTWTEKTIIQSGRYDGWVSKAVWAADSTVVALVEVPLNACYSDFDNLTEFSIHLWNVKEQRIFFSFPYRRGSEVQVSFAPDTEDLLILYSYWTDNSISFIQRYEIWDLKTFEQTDSMELTDGGTFNTRNTEFYLLNNSVMFALYDIRKIDLWNIAQVEMIDQSILPPGQIQAISGDNQYVATGNGDERTLTYSNIETGEILWQITVPSAIEAVFWNGDELIAYFQYFVRVYSIADGQLLRENPYKEDAPRQQGLFVMDSWSDEAYFDHIRFWDIDGFEGTAWYETGYSMPILHVWWQSNRYVQTFSMGCGAWGVEHTWDVEGNVAIPSGFYTAEWWDSETWSPDNTLHASTEWNDATFRLETNIHVYARSSDNPQSFPRTTLTGHQEQVVDVTFSPDNKLLASASYDGTSRVWLITLEGEVLTGMLLGEFQTGDPRVEVAIFSADSNYLITGSSNGMIRIWNIETGDEIAALTGHTGKISELTISPDGSLLASTSYDGTLRIWGIPK